MNTPYVKKYDESGNLINPIEKSYISTSPNRMERRYKQPRIHGNGNNYHLTIVKGSELGGERKYRRIDQLERDKKGNIKTIIHYL